MRVLTPVEIEIVTYINLEHVASTGSIAYKLSEPTCSMRRVLNNLAAIGVIKRHPYSCANCIKWMMNK